MKQNNNKNNQSEDTLDPIVGMFLALCFCVGFLYIGIFVNSFGYPFSILSAAIAITEWRSRKN